MATDRPGTLKASASLGSPVYHNVKTYVLIIYECLRIMTNALAIISLFLFVCVQF